VQHACAQMINDHGSSLLHAAAATMPKALFIFLPLVAFLHMLMYWWPRHRYAVHLLFFLHLSAFFFCVATLLVLSGDVAGAWPGYKRVDHSLSTVLFWLLPLYTLLAMRRVFQRSWFNTAVKFCALFGIYVLVLAITVTGVFFYAALQI
jgi:hypothetical protein